MAHDKNQQIKERLKTKNIQAQSYKANLLWEPWEVTKADGTPYRVFTPFYRRGCLNAESPRRPLEAPAQIDFANNAEIGKDLGFYLYCKARVASGSHSQLAMRRRRRS